MDDFYKDLILLLFGFVLTTIGGMWLANWLDRTSWQRQTRIDLYKRRYEEGIQFLDTLSQLIGRRHFQLQRVLWALKDMEDNPEKLEEIEEEYFEIVGDWNASYWMHRNKIRLLVGEQYANLFLDYGDDQREKAHSVHYSFVQAHRAVQQAKAGEVEAEEAQEKVNDLSRVCSSFQELVTYEFRKKAASLELLNMTKSENGG